ncbi:unnamed protein product [marine sediment metagenome]|uniref:Uncharacterized protein n=1 Tax=marine sediment metagenome TaxID=412755 RepID=X1BX58_9ZZZZ
MNDKTKDTDNILEEKRIKSLTAVSFLEALKDNLDKDKAFQIACEAFANYMIGIYEEILGSTAEQSLERFDKFRKFYEDYAIKTPYLQIIESPQNF